MNPPESQSIYWFELEWFKENLISSKVIYESTGISKDSAGSGGFVKKKQYTPKK